MFLYNIFIKCFNSSISKIIAQIILALYFSSYALFRDIHELHIHACMSFKLLKGTDAACRTGSGRSWTIPVCFDPIRVIRHAGCDAAARVRRGFTRSHVTSIKQSRNLLQNA